MSRKPFTPSPRVEKSQGEHTPLLGGVGGVHPERLSEQTEDTGVFTEDRAR